MFTVRISCLFKISFAGRILFVICIIYLLTYAVDVEQCSDITSKMNCALSVDEDGNQFDSCCQCCPSLKQNAQVNCFITQYAAQLSSTLIQNSIKVHAVDSPYRVKL